ncbi:MAG: mechanosensitive ion channel family protein [Candidatus Hydrogenedentes bacterium]|nr:mechanosensitive ion channel family protein [Candidatus Hydrogenedentota bacterium]
MWRGFIGHLPLIGIAVVILLLTWAVSKAVTYAANRSLRHTRMRGSLRELFARLLYIAVWIVGILVAAMVVFPGLTPSKALAALGLGSIAIGFAFKDIFENFFAGILILGRFPFENGDFIEVNGITGKVEDVTIRNTLLRQVTGELVVIPNANIFNNPVFVLTNWPMRRVTVITGVAYGEDVDQSRQVIADALAQRKTPKKERPVEIYAQEFADSSINFEVTWWCGATPKDLRASRDEVVAAVKRALDEAGIEIPFPYRTLTFKEPLRTIGDEKK